MKRAALRLWCRLRGHRYSDYGLAIGPHDLHCLRCDWRADPTPRPLTRR